MLQLLDCLRSLPCPPLAPRGPLEQLLLLDVLVMMVLLQLVCVLAVPLSAPERRAPSRVIQRVR